MRELKFRAWDKERMRMTTYFYMTSTGIVKNANLEKLLEDMNVEIVQYTNKKDKNNSEIYKDDCLKWKDNIFRVEWDKFNARWYGKPHIGNISRGILMAITFENSEIIGNKFKNPELYEDVK